MCNLKYWGWECLRVPEKLNSWYDEKELFLWISTILRIFWGENRTLRISSGRTSSTYSSRLSIVRVSDNRRGGRGFSKVSFKTLAGTYEKHFEALSYLKLSELNHSWRIIGYRSFPIRFVSGSIFGAADGVFLPTWPSFGLGGRCVRGLTWAGRTPRLKSACSLLFEAS